MKAYNVTNIAKHTQDAGRFVKPDDGLNWNPRTDSVFIDSWLNHSFALFNCKC